MSIATSPLTLVTSFAKATPDSYWHYLMAHETNPRKYENQTAIASVIKKISQVTGEPNSFSKKSVNGWSPLHVAALTGNGAGFKFLLLQGVPTAMKDKFGQTPLDYCQTFHPELLPLIHTPLSVPIPSQNNSPLSPFLESKRIKLFKGPFIYQANTNDFGVEIKELLFTMPNDDSQAMREVYRSTGMKIDHFVTNIQALSHKLGFRLALSNFQYFVRDHWIKLPDGKFVLSSDSENIPKALGRNQSLSVIQQNKAAFLTSHLFLCGGIGAAKRNSLKAAYDFKKILGETKCLRFYFEGGNYYLVTINGLNKLILGTDILQTALNQFRLEKLFDDPLINVNVGVEKILPTLTLEKARDTLAEMYAQGLLQKKPGCEKGFIEEVEISNLITLATKCPADQSPQHKKLAIQLNYYSPMDLSPEKIRGSYPIVAKYLAHKIITKQIIAYSFMVGLEDLIFIPQADYHLDVFMRPGPNNSFFVQDYQCTIDMLLAIQENAQKLQLTSTDLTILIRYIATARLLEQQLKPLFLITHESLKSAGFTIIPTPGLIYDESPLTLNPEKPHAATTYNLNFINAISGYSPKTENYYYIAGGAKVGDRLGAVLMNVFTDFLKLHQNGIDVYFIGHDPKNSTDFTENMRWQNRYGAQAGPHCLSAEFETASHTTTGNEEMKKS